MQQQAKQVLLLAGTTYKKNNGVNPTIKLRTIMAEMALKLLAGASWMGEYGDPTTDDWDFLQEYSPYHNVDAATEYFGLRLADLQSRKRTRTIALPRQICMYLAREHTRYSLEEIGGYFGGRDHTTVMHARPRDNHVVAPSRAILSQPRGL